MATDSSGALYVYALPGGMSASSVMKLSPEGTTILWQNMLGFRVSTMAVSPSGDVFVVPVSQPADTSVYVEKLSTGGSGVTWTAAAGFSFIGEVAPVLTADSQGRTYVAAPSDGSINTAKNPAAPGSIVSVFATGLGPVKPTQADGALVSIPPPSNAVLAGVEAESYVLSPRFGLRLTSASVPVTYAGPAPHLVAGTGQVNFRIPPPDAAIDFYLAPGGLNMVNLPSSTTSQVSRSTWHVSSAAFEAILPVKARYGKHHSRYKTASGT